VDHPLNHRIEPGSSSFSHIFVLNGFAQYGLATHDGEAWGQALHLLEEFADGAGHRPVRRRAAHRGGPGQRAQGPFMIALGAATDILETLRSLSPTADPRAEPFRELGRLCLEHI